MRLQQILRAASLLPLAVSASRRDASSNFRPSNHAARFPRVSFLDSGRGRASNSLYQAVGQIRGGSLIYPELEATATATVRGGGEQKQKEKQQNSPPTPSPSNSNTPKKSIAVNMPQDKLLIGSVGIIVVGALLYKYREALRPFMDKQYIQEHTLSILRKLEQNPASIPIYVLGMAVWEFLGLSTIPVETAAGMVFGPLKGLLASGLGKLGGAYTAFWLGRTVLASYVRTKMEKTKAWSILDKSTDVHSPLVVALLMKFSCFPEFVKNFGCSCLDVPFATFAAATAMHGLTFTTLWTLLGVDAAARLEQPDLPANVALQVLLVLAAMVGLVGSPLLMAWWFRDMRRIAESQK